MPPPSSGSKKNPSKKQHEAGSKQSKYVHPKRRLSFNRLHAVISQKVELFTVINKIQAISSVAERLLLYEWICSVQLIIGCLFVWLVS
jgi:hypothetical protein